jgi:hypothetical protein
MVEQRHDFWILQEIIKNCVSDNGDESLLSAAYLALLGRNGFDLYSRDGVHVVVCAHPNDTNSILVLPEIATNKTQLQQSSLLPDVLKSLSHEEKEVRLARFSQDQLAQLRQKMSDKPQDTIEKIETVVEDKLDWHYPAHVLSTKAVSMLDGGQFKRIRKKLCMLESKHELNHTSINEEGALNKMRFIMTRWEAKMILDGRADMGRDVVSVYEAMFERLQQNPNAYEGRIFYVDGQPTGMSIWDKNSKNNAVLLVNLTDHSVQDLSVFQIVETCKALDAQGIRYCDLGGSEDEGLNRFKESFRPEASVTLQSAIVTYHRPVFKREQMMGWA